MQAVALDYKYPYKKA